MVDSSVDSENYGLEFSSQQAQSRVEILDDDDEDDDDDMSSYSSLEDSYDSQVAIEHIDDDFAYEKQER